MPTPVISTYLIIAECSVGYHLLPSSNVCVKLYPNYLSWNDSVAACINEGAGLPILNTDIIYSEFRVYLDNVSNAGRHYYSLQ